MSHDVNVKWDISSIVHPQDNLTNSAIVDSEKISKNEPLS